MQYETQSELWANTLERASCEDLFYGNDYDNC